MAWYFQNAAAVKHAVQPVQHEVGRNEEQYRLHPERKLRQRPMAIVVECDQFVGLMNVEDDCGAEHQQPDAEDTRKYRHEEPVTDVGNELALAPPGFARIAGPEMREHREHQSERDRDRNDLRHRLAHHLDDFHWQTGHDGLVRSETFRGIRSRLRSRESKESTDTARGRDERPRRLACILSNGLIRCLLCSRTASSRHFCTVELTASKLSHP